MSDRSNGPGGGNAKGTNKVPQCGAKVRWSTIKKDAYGIFLALGKLDDLLRGIAFTIKTDLRNLAYMNKHGSRKVLQ